MFRRFVGLALGVWLVVQSAVAHAEPAAAEEMFRKGRELLRRGEIGPACEAFETSQRLEPSSGTLLNLAVCRLEQGKTATAWAHFGAAERLAESQGRADQANEARRRKLELEPTLTTLTLSVTAPPPGLEVRLNGVTVQPESLGTRVPVDPGKVEVSASAPGHEPLSFEVTLSETENQRVVVPTLKELSASPDMPAAAPRASEPEVTREESSSNPWPWVVGGVGGAALVAGGIFGVMALSSNSEAQEQCGQRTSDCPQGAVKTAERRDREALASTIGIGVGLVGVGVAVLWGVSSPSKREATAWSYAAEVTPDRAFLRVRAGF